MNFVPMPVESWLNYGMISKTSEEQGRAVRKKIMMFISVLLFLQPSLSLAVEMPAPGEKMAQARLVSDSDGVAPGRPLQLGILLSHRQGWHTYWENPGDAGLPTSVTWALPEGFSAGEMRWPVPSRLKEGDLVVYGYSGELFLAATVAVPPALDREEYRFHALVSYLICNDICVPEEYSLDLVLPAVESARPSADAPQFAAAAAAQPKTLAQAAQFSFSGDSVRLSLPQAALDGADSAPASGEFFPRQPSLINNGASQQLAVGNGAVTLTLKKSEDRFEEPQAGGILVLNSPGRSGAYDIHFDIGMKLPPLNAFGMAGEAAPPEAPFLPALLLLAMLGGLVLNLMPCVLPVLSLKALTLVHKAGSTHSHSRMLGVAYTLGILVSFAALAGLLIGLQQAGEAVGWGYQMQSPAFVGFLVYLLFLVGLNLSGIFELPVLLGDVGQELTRASSPKGSFFTGMLATAVATPCTAPFMASAVGVALTLPAWQALLVFLSLGFGLALPFLLISFFPRLLRFLPKPGAWMNTFKHVLAWPMYASVAWLLWVLSLQTGMGGAGGGACWHGADYPHHRHEAPIRQSHPLSRGGDWTLFPDAGYQPPRFGEPQATGRDDGGRARRGRRGNPPLLARRDNRPDAARQRHISRRHGGLVHHLPGQCPHRHPYRNHPAAVS